MSEKTNTTGRAIGTVAALVALAAAAPVEGAVIISSISEVNIKNITDLDIDGDTQVDFTVSGGQGVQIFGRTVNEQILTLPSFEVRYFSGGDTISSDLLGSDSVSVEDGLTTVMIGFRFTNTDGSHMGFMSASTPLISSDSTITIHSIQWESVPGASIIATSVPEPGCVMLVASFGVLAMSRRRRESTGS